MWTQGQIEEIVRALWHLPADKLLEVKQHVLAVKDRHGYAEPVDCQDAWTREDELDFSADSMQRLHEADPTGEVDGQ